MAGHSKWAKVKHQKAVTDVRKGKLFTKCLREIEVSARSGGVSLDNNPRLKAAVQEAKSEGVPSDTIDRAIKRGGGIAADGVQIEDVVYEGYGPGGAAVLVRALTDNRVRTAADVRHAFTKCGGNLAGSNAVSYLFKKRGVLSIPRSVAEDALLSLALDAGAEDVRDDGEAWEVVTAPEACEVVRKSLEAAGMQVAGGVREVPENTVRVAGAQAEAMLELLEMLEDLDDVQKVSSNFDIDEAELQKLAQGK